MFGFARLAFEANKEPVSGNNFINRDSKGTCTQYVDEEFVNDVFSHVIKVEVKRVVKGGEEQAQKPPVQVSVEQSVAIPTHTQDAWPKYKGADHSAYLWIRKGSTSPVINISILSKAEPDADEVAQGSFSLPAGWASSTQQTAMLLKLEPSATTSLTLTVELSVAVLNLERLQEPELDWPSESWQHVDSKVAEVAQDIQAMLKSHGRMQYTADVHRWRGTRRSTPKHLSTQERPRSLNTASTPLLREDSVLEGSHHVEKRRCAYTFNAEISGENESSMAAADAALAHGAPDACFMHGAQPIAFIENPLTDTQVVVLRNLARKQLGVAFRGTEGVLKDVLTDISIQPAIFNAEGAAVDGPAQPCSRWWWPWKSCSGRPQALVHSGFLKAWRSVQPAIERAMEDCMHGDAHWSVIFAGHSLGGALATLAAATEAARGVIPSERIACYTWGCPRVGNDTFVERFNRMVPQCWRTFHRHDVVPKVPRITGFVPVANGLCMSHKGASERVLLAFVDGVPSTLDFSSISVSVKELGDMIIPPVVRDTFWGGMWLTWTLVMGILTRRGIAQHRMAQYLLSMQKLVRELEAPAAMHSISADDAQIGSTIAEIDHAMAATAQGIELYRKAEQKVKAELRVW